MKQIVLSVIIILFWSCKNEPTPASKQQTQQSKIAGRTMGTSYHITYIGQPRKSLKTSVDSLLVKINQEVSTYEKDAIISQYNRSESGVELDSKSHSHFISNYKAAETIHQITNGYFDPTVMPLVNYWGFGYTGKEGIKQIDSLKVNTLLNLIGMDRVTGIDDKLFLRKQAPAVQLDFSAHAKGYGVDMVCQLLEQNKINDYYVEIGGEVRCKGKNARGTFWTIGINTPAEKANVSDFLFKLQLQNEAMATSGNYRNVYELDGVKYSHTINPFTGFPERNQLLSATVIADDCMTADAYATAFMTMGLEKAFELASKNTLVKAAFIYSDDEGIMQVKLTDGVEPF